MQFKNSFSIAILSCCVASLAIGLSGCRSQGFQLPSPSRLAFWKKDNLNLASRSNDIPPPASHFQPGQYSDGANSGIESTSDSVDSSLASIKNRINELQQNAQSKSETLTAGLSAGGSGLKQAQLHGNSFAVDTEVAARAVADQAAEAEASAMNAAAKLADAGNLGTPMRKPYSLDTLTEKVTADDSFSGAAQNTQGFAKDIAGTVSNATAAVDQSFGSGTSSDSFRAGGGAFDPGGSFAPSQAVDVIKQAAAPAKNALGSTLAQSGQSLTNTISNATNQLKNKATAVADGGWKDDFMLPKPEIMNKAKDAIASTKQAATTIRNELTPNATSGSGTRVASAANAFQSGAQNIGSNGLNAINNAVANTQRKLENSATEFQNKWGNQNPLTPQTQVAPQTARLSASSNNPLFRPQRVESVNQPQTSTPSQQLSQTGSNGRYSTTGMGSYQGTPTLQVPGFGQPQPQLDSNNLPQNQLRQNPAPLIPATTPQYQATPHSTYGQSQPLQPTFGSAPAKQVSYDNSFGAAGTPGTSNVAQASQFGLPASLQSGGSYTPGSVTTLNNVQQR